MIPIRLNSLRSLAFASSTCALLAQPTDFQSRPAIFEVTTDIVNEDVQPFTFTAGAFGNTLKRAGKGSFEPATFRDKLSAQKDSPNRIYGTTGASLTSYDSFQSGYLDGADIQVYRIVDGAVKLVREDTVTDGGTVLEYWEYSINRTIPAGTTDGKFAWEGWNRKGSERWFTILSVDTSGNVSEVGETFKFTERQPEKGATARNETSRVRPIRNPDRDAPPTPTNIQAAYNEQGVIEFSWDPACR